MIRVGIADDHQLFAEGVRGALDALPDIRVVFVASNVGELVDHLSDQPADVVLLDLEMPGGGGHEALRRISKTPCLVVTMHISPETVDLSFRRGARGVLSKSAPLADLAASIRALASGVILPVDGSELRQTLDQYRDPGLDPGAAALTDREIEVLSLLAKGVSSTEELASRLFISQKTVKNHLASIFQKLSVSDRTQAAVEAIRLGIGKPK